MSDSAISPTAAASPATPAEGAASPRPTKAQIHVAAQKFEAMLTRQMLAEARKTDFGSTLLTNEGTKTFREMQDSRFADTASQQGTLGFAKMIEAQLSRQTGIDVGHAVNSVTRALSSPTTSAAKGG